ncbi:MAG: hypothetical protein QOJ92_369 [Frankiales bacterium]|nr:hypothetical protein [Frankiales bacterium]
MDGSATDSSGMNSSARTGLGRGIGYGLVAALVGAAAWAVLTVVTDYKIGIVAVAIGFLVGLAMQRSNSTDPRLPIAGAVLALLGCFLGDVFTDAHALASVLSDHGVSTSTMEVLRKMIEDPRLFWDVYKAGFAGLDVAFYAIAAYEGFKFAAIGVQKSRHAATPPPPFPPAAPAGESALPGAQPGQWGASPAAEGEPENPSGRA